MPQNNLNAQIKWLLSVKPFIPPLTSLVAYDPQAQPTSSAIQDPLLLSSHSTVQDASEIPTNLPIIDPTPPPPPPSDRLQHTTTSSSGERAPEEMARLRGPPGSGKPRLRIAQPDPDDTDTRDVPAKTTIAPSSSVWTPSLGMRVAPHVKADEIDLTGEDETFVLSPVRPKQGKKRKSEDYEDDYRAQKSPRPAKIQSPIKPAKFAQDEFPDIEELPAAPSTPPPPYSTAVPTEYEQFHFDDDDDPGFRIADSDDDMIMPDAEPAAPATTTLKRKSWSRVPSESSIPPRKVGKSVQDPSPKKYLKASQSKVPSPGKQQVDALSKKRHEVLDSEDEDFGDIDDMELHTSPRPYASTPQQRKDSICLKKSPAQSPFVDRKVQLSLPIRSPSKSSNTPSARPHERVVPTNTRGSPIKSQLLPSQKRLVSNGKLDSGIQSSSEESKQRVARIRKTVEDFLAAEGSRLRQHLNRAQSQWERAREAFTEHLEEYGEADPGETEKMQLARSRKDALEKLVDLESTHRQLTAERQEIRRRIIEQMENGETPLDGGAAHRVTKSLEDVEGQIDAYIQASGIRLLTRGGSLETADNVMVRSTQASPAMRTATLVASPRRDRIPQTQYVKQTQISVREVWTPDRGVVFAEDASRESPSPHRPFKTGPILRESRTGDERSMVQGSSRRIPETPQRRPSTGIQGILKSVRESSDHDDSFHTAGEGYGDEFDDEENLFYPGTPPAQVNGEHDSCGDDFFNDDDADYLDDLQEIGDGEPVTFDWKGDVVAPSSKPVRGTTVPRGRQRQDVISPTKSLLSIPGMNHPWSAEVREALLQKFRLTGFRPGQLDAINTTLNGQHCFVLMPTGGGKSLCYQLPAVIRSGKTHGVTIVISPLLSLMEDQVNACRERFGMGAYLINGQTDEATKKHIMQGLNERDPQKFIQVLYVTPEMLGKSERMIGAMRKLHDRNRLARIVIDEAHCVSQWGHDFRPDYKALGGVLGQFAGVPIIALTATATQLVQTDVMTNLGITGCRKFAQSFNRPNLSYEVRAKERGVIDSIATLIKSKFKGKCGIVYCLARKTCESVAQKLTDKGVLAYHYHAGMEPEERSQVQQKWQANKYHVIVATIAFGMGIDKADVRFVVHHSLPKSLEGYYQETGRAGRDGLRSWCYLYYTYGDSNTLRQMIEKGEGSREQKQRQHDMLRSVISYCENKKDCRRAQVLSYFSEAFRSEDCHQTCDNCASGKEYVEKDLTDYASAAIRLVTQLEHANITMHQCIDAFRGAPNSKLKSYGVKEFGYGEHLHRGDVERLFSRLAEDGAIKQASKLNKAGFATNYVKLDRNSSAYGKKGGRRLKLQVSAVPPKEAKAPKKKRAAVPTSTNVTSPRAPRKKNIQDYAYDDSAADVAPGRKKGTTRARYAADDFVVPDDQAEDESDAFEPIHAPKQRAVAKDRRTARPMTVEDRVAQLNETQKAILDNFVEAARAAGRDILMKKNLRNQPFSNTILTQMGLDLPEDKEEMLQIPGISADMVSRYGAQYLKLIKQLKEMYGNDPPNPTTHPSRRRNTDRGANDDDDAEYDQIHDPNHQNVIDLCSSPPPEDEEFVDAEEEEEEFEEYEPLGRRVSHHFAPTSIDPEVEAFNRIGSQLTSKGRGSSGKFADDREPLPKKRNLPWAVAKKGYKRKSGGAFPKRGGGVRKQPAARKSGGGAGASKRGSEGGAAARPSGSGWSGVIGMPT
ncbi:hypothetical protein M011DRAFT_455049 [Sporormia fimetaria CBS 119925]|uniref:DNA 3'-5' helicase n=1 Tax=Sporormia fimetaria CBS 119925 TaxID=1340428 RepID=A0A6A6VSI8_9PLEO|nr:hypothetical protein M011DRAFT_455049 [Sporormia fimetaria CBS 119925]